MITIAKPSLKMLHQVILNSPTGRIRLVPADAAYDEAIAALRTHPETRRYLSMLPFHLSSQEVANRRESRTRDPSTFDFYIIYKTNELEPKSLFVGTTGLAKIDRYNKSCDIGILVDPAFHNAGVATEALYLVLRFAFESGVLECPMHRVVFETSPENIKMRGWLEKFGVQMEYRLRKAWKVYAEDSWEDGVGYSILDDEWREVVKPNLESRLKW